MFRTITLAIIAFSCLFIGSCSVHKPITYAHITGNTAVSSMQNINIVSVPLNSKKFSLSVAYDSTLLKPTSVFGIESGAEIALNGGFFDMKNGGSVSYLEVNDEVITYTPKPNSLINGAIVINKNKSIEIGFKKEDQIYAQSKKEAAVMVAGPLLLQNGQKVQLDENNKFVNTLHPRTCACISSDNMLLLFTIDGRNENALGMSLSDAQNFLLRKNCIDAINLDGGGSTTIWSKEKGVFNTPSDKMGERKVANALIIVRN